MNSLNRTTLLLSAAAILVAGAASAQPAPPPGGPRPGPEAGAPPPPPGNPRRGPEAPPPPPKAAHFRLERGETAVDVKCADDEPMKACADLTLQMLDRLARMPDPGRAEAPKPDAR